MCPRKKQEMSKSLEALLGGLHLAAVVQVNSMSVYEVSDAEREVHVDCRGLDWDAAIPLGLYFFGNFSDDEIGALKNLYAPGRFLRVEGAYSLLPPEDGGVTVYNSTTTEIPDEDIEWLKARLATSIKWDVSK